ncbi:MAG: glycosyl hydrolase 53 family protein [Clostridia bacterium]|nr:glycosyl hydrolase 53 family protein [Clostridia bacterium]
MRRHLLFWTLIFLIALSLSHPGQASDLPSSSLFVPKIEGLHDGFYLGMDVSSVLAEEASGVHYYDFDGRERDLFALLSENGINLIRVRIWNDPYDAEGHGFGGGNNDLTTALDIARRAQQYGLSLMVDFHYSDFWADPSKQMTPRAWEGMAIKDKAQALYEYTLDSLQQLRETGADIAIVQIGNETNGRFCGEKIWMNIVHHLMKAGSRAVREVCPEAKVAVHFANPENAENYLSWASKLAYYDLDYDIFATSYYPWWHGSIENLKSVLSEIRTTYGKDVMVAEMSYAWTLEDGDFSGNSIGEGGGYEVPYPISVQGQALALSSVTQAMCDIGGIGVCWWEGAWVPVGRVSREENSLKWERYGSGWASSYAGIYDPDDAGVYYGGSACDNQTLFDFDGHALESLKTFLLMRTGNEVELRPESIEHLLVDADIAGEITLPDHVDAIMNDGSRTSLPVTWEDLDFDAMKAAGPASYEVSGMTDVGMMAQMTLRLVNFNYLLNPSFEESDDSMWTADNFGGTEQLYAEEKKTDSLSGNRHYHFYSSKSDAVGFTLSQAVTNCPEGTYRFSISIMGGDAGDYECYAYVLVDGVEAGRASGQITSWNKWDTMEVPDIHVPSGSEVTCGVYVVCHGTGAWGKIDDAVLERTGN